MSVVGNIDEHLDEVFGIIEKHQDWLRFILKTTNSEWSWDRTLITLAHTVT